MSKGWIAVLAAIGIAGVALVGVKIAQTKKNSEDIFNKIKYTYSNLKMKISHFVVSVSIDVDVTNLSTFTIPVKNLSVVAQYLKNNIYTDLAYTKTPISGFTLLKNQTTKVTGLTLDCPLAATIWNIFQALIGNITKIKLITTYYVNGFEMKDEQIIPIKAAPGATSNLSSDSGESEIMLNEVVSGVGFISNCNCSKLIA